ncbi:hypothetical protein DVV91_16685 [Clostridium botulinum]|uniref:hypothetical protein n=1 Tax=Clostridium botulinum TaxID=1491 RepID=UPI0019674F0E|nr:hypothetical protein [Clostridium botulinum]MBN1075959.1 hypothetical protein [Clostridium botulinum]
MTNYDDIWSCLLDIIGVSKDLLPSDEEDIYREIHNGVRNYNIKTSDYEKKLITDDSTESLNCKIDDYRLKLIALLIKQNILQNELEYFQAVYQYDIKEIRSKFYKDQMSGRNETIREVKHEISEILSYMSDYDFN